MRTRDFYLAVLVALSAASVAAASDARTAKHEKLNPLLGVWETAHSIPSRDGEPIVVTGEATIEWVTGGAWLRHEFRADFPGRGEVFLTTMMNYSPAKSMYNFYMFDHFGGEAGVFYGDWNEDDSIVLKAKFENDGTVSYQKFTLTPVSESEIWVSRAFSDDGTDYHFELKGVYTRKGR